MAKDRTKDLTQGTPWKVIAGFSLPVIGGNLFQLFYTLADSMIVGRTLGADALAAVGATATIVYFVLCFIQAVQVAPFAGAWIEIRAVLLVVYNKHCRSLRRSVD